MRISLRYIFRLSTAFLKKFKGLIALGFVIGIVFFISLRFIIPKLLNSHTKKIGITGKYYTDSLPINILSKISDGLTFVNKNQEVEPSIAEKWESSDGGKTWTFKIKDNIFWQDGEKLVSSDIKYNLSGIKVEYPDSETITFRLEDEYSPFPSVVSLPVFKRGLLGTGSWKVEKISISGSFVRELVIKNKNNEKIIYKFYPTEERSKLALKLGQVDKITEIYDEKPFDKWNNLKINKNISNDIIVTMFFNAQDKLLAEKSLRQALFYAIDKSSFPGKRALSPIPEKSWSYNPQVKPYYYNKKKAESLIDALPKELKKNLEIKLVTPPLLLPIAENIVNDWKKVGINSSVLVSSVIPNDFQAFLTLYETPKDPDQYTIWHSTQGETNISKYKNPRIDKLLEDGRTELNIETRRKIYLDFQRFLMEDLPAAFLYYPYFYTIERK